MEITLPLILTTGLLDSFNPCAISLLLLYIAMLYSMKKDHKTIMLFGFFYIASVYVTYYLIGLGLLKIVNTIGFPGAFKTFGAVFAILFGLLNIKEYFFPDSKWNIRIPLEVRAKASEWAHKATIPAAIVLGVLIGINEFPCSGAVYIAIITYLNKHETFFRGAGYLALYNLVFVAPLLLIYAFASNRLVTERMINLQEKLGRRMHLLLAALMIGLGITMFLIK